MFRISTCGAWLMGIATAFWCNCALAQITPDATLPNNSIVNINGNTFNITGGTQAGTNLFHSFQQFSVPTGGGALFNNTVDIQNIISRVTGGSISNIDGLIRTLGTANLFLINPNGIVFGPNARLDIGGSFIASTASSINFADGTKFSATPSPEKPLLTITAPLGLNMGSNPGPIQVQGPGHEFVYDDATIKYSNADEPGSPRPRLNTSVPGLQVESGKTLALVGGKVSVEGGVLKSPAGRIEIGSVASNQAVSLVSVAEGWKLGYEAAASFADIQFSGKSFVSTTGVGGGAIAVAGKNINFTSESILRADTLGDTNGGEISIIGENIAINQSDISSNSFSSGNTGQIKLVANNSIRLENQAGVGTGVLESGKAGDITLQADSIFIGNSSGLSSNTYGAGNAGRMEVKANSLVIEDQSTLSNGTGNNSTGNGGEVNINVAGPLLLVGGGTSISTYSFGQSNAGKIDMRANSLRIEDGAAIVSSTENNSTANAGDININVAGPLVANGAGIVTDTKTGNAAKLNITANSLLIENSGVFSRTINTGKAGEINFNIAGPLVINKASIGTDAYGTGEAGKINISANSLLIESAGVNSQASKDSTGNSGEININVADRMVLRKGGISTNSVSEGDAGKISISANSLLIEDSGVNSQAKEGSTGNSGEININVADRMVLRRGGISTNSVGEGDAGKISITANSFDVETSEVNSTTTNTGKAGEINLNVAGPLVINDAAISTDTSGTGNAGQITVTAESLKINSGGIVATSTGSGDAGNLSVRTKTLVLDNEGRLEVKSTGEGNAGTLNIVADTIKLNNQGLIDASTSSGNGGDLRLDVANLLLLRNGSQISATAGTAQQGGNGGNITINARDGLIVAVPNENSDITANAFTGKGGQIEINTSGLFGIQPSFQLTPNNDITAFSQSGISGEITINRADVEQRLESVELPAVVADTSNVIDTSCAAFAEGEGNSFTITGRGGLPPSPYEPLSSDVLWSDNRILNIASQQRTEKPSTKPATKDDAVKIVPATGWVFDGKGHVTLISHASNSNNLGATPACQKK